MWNTEWTNFIHTRYVIPVFLANDDIIANVNVKSRSRSRFCLKMASGLLALPVLAAWHTFCCLFVIALTNKDWLIDCSLYVVVRPSAVCDVCAPKHHTQSTEIFGNVSTPFGPNGTLAIHWLPEKILWRSSFVPREPPVFGCGLNARGVAKAILDLSKAISGKINH